LGGYFVSDRLGNNFYILAVVCGIEDVDERVKKLISGEG
jgi:hypothetical protein